MTVVSETKMKLAHDHLPLPSRRYVPGAGGEPDRGPLNAAKATIKGPMQPERWAAHAAYRYGARLHVDGFFWEAHEVWEAVWLTCAHNSAERHLLRGLIQTTNAALKLVMRRRQAAQRLLAEADGLFLETERCLGSRRGPFMGVDLAALRGSLQALVERIPHDAVGQPTSTDIVRAPLFSIGGLDNR